MAAGPGTLKVAGTVGTLCACGLSAVTVLSDTRPAGAPLNPPVSRPAAQGAAAGATPGPSDAPLVIPATATCATAAGGSRPAPPPELRAAVARLRQARTAADRQAVLAGLTPDQRMQLTAYLQLLAQSRGSSGAAGLGCRGAGAGQPGGAVTIDPSVVAGDAGAPVAVSAVS